MGPGTTDMVLPVCMERGDVQKEGRLQHREESEREKREKGERKRREEYEKTRRKKTVCNIIRAFVLHHILYTDTFASRIYLGSLRFTDL